jgi:DNA adenine methylase
MQLIQASDSIEALSHDTLVSVPPFLRWAGGKTWFVKRYSKQLAELAFDAYHEPFLGGGSVFFSMPSFGKAHLADRNTELIETYSAVKECPEEVISALAEYRNDEASYYDARSSSPSGDIAKAARFIFLNQTSYNGIYRVNLRGEYNVPFGRRTKNFLDPDAILAASVKLRSANLYSEDFSQSIYRVSAGDLVFIDPPYTVSHNKNGFIKYNKNLFNLEDYYRLRDYVEAIRGIGAKYILTNAAHEKVREIFNFGDRVHEVSRANLIGGLKAARGQISELIFTNLGEEF